MTDLATLGWDQGWDTAFEPYATAGLVPARVAIQHRGAYDVLTEEGDTRGRVSGRLLHEAASPADLPVVGDWVAVEQAAGADATIHAVLPRRTKFSRRAAQDPVGAVIAREQVVAANVDVVFVVLSLADELDRPMLERYLALAWESGARPVILLTKADLDVDPESVVAALSDVGGDVPVHPVSARSRLGLDAVDAELGSGSTGALVGPSGVGKSTLVNALAGEELLATAGLRADGSGRHTTTRRQLVLLPGGGLLVDNPGMREVHLWLADDGFEEAFADVAELETRCRFADCRHEAEPGCAILAALADGSLSADRWQRYRSLQLELAELDTRLAARARGKYRSSQNPRS